jgi:hypothetical protein
VFGLLAGEYATTISGSSFIAWAKVKGQIEKPLRKEIIAAR